MTISLKEALNKYFAENYSRLKDKIDESYLDDKPFSAENCNNCTLHKIIDEIHYCVYKDTTVMLDKISTKTKFSPEDAKIYLLSKLAKDAFKQSECKTDNYYGKLIEFDDIKDYISKRNEIISKVTDKRFKSIVPLLDFVSKEEGRSAACESNTNKYKAKTLDSFL